MNYYGIWAIYKHEMARAFKTAVQTLAAPVISTVLYFIVFGSAIGGSMSDIDGVSYGAFIVPGLIMMTVLVQSIANASFGIYFPRFSGTIYEILSAPLSLGEVAVGFVGAAATKSMIVATIVLLTAGFFVPFEVQHPVWMFFFLLMTCITFSLFGFIIGIWADDFEKIQLIPALVVTPLTFLGGSFYAISMLPEFWQMVSRLNPVVYLISAFRWSFYGTADVNLTLSVTMIVVFLLICMGFLMWIFKTGYKLRN